MTVTLTAADREKLSTTLAEYDPKSVADSIGITRQHLWQVTAARGKKEPSAKLLTGLCEVLGLSCEIVPARAVIAAGEK